MPTRALLRASTAVVAMLTFVVCAACVLQTTQFACADGTAQVMYRLYNPNSGEHFYTADVSERDAVAAAGWSYEGEGWTAPTVSSTPVYRLYSGTDHHYCTGEGRRTPSLPPDGPTRGLAGTPTTPRACRCTASSTPTSIPPHP